MKRRLLQNHDTLMMWVQRIVNAAAVVLTLFVLAYWRDGSIGTHYRYMAIITVLTMLLVYHYFGVHRRFESRIGGVQHLARAWGVVVIIVSWVGFLTKTAEDYSRQVIFIWAVAAFFLQAWIFPFFYWIHLKYQEKYGTRLIPAFVIGTEEIANHITNSVNRNIWLPDRIIGAVAVDQQGMQLWKNDSAAVLGTLDQLESLIIKHQVRRVYIALPLRLSHLI